MYIKPLILSLSFVGLLGTTGNLLATGAPRSAKVVTIPYDVMDLFHPRGEELPEARGL